MKVSPENRLSVYVHQDESVRSPCMSFLTAHDMSIIRHAAFIQLYPNALAGVVHMYT